MSRETRQAIDDAIRAHLADILESVDSVSVVTGWVIAVEVQNLEGGEAQWDNDFELSETTSSNTAIGLSIWLTDTLRNVRKEDDAEPE